MKKLKYIIIVLLVFMVCGCTTNYNRGDINKYVIKEIGIRNFSVSKTYEVMRDEDGYKDRYWKVHDTDNDIDFYVIDDYYYSSEMTNNSLETDYYSRYYVRYESILNTNNNLEYEVLPTTGLDGDIELICKYSNKNGLERCFESLRYLNKTFKKKVNIPYIIKYKFNGRRDETKVKYSADYIGNIYNIDEDDFTYYNYFYYGKVFDVSSIINEMGTEDYNSILNNASSINLVKVDTKGNTTKKYNDIFCLNSYNISYSGLYKLLKEEGYNVTGNSHNYQVIDNGSIYEFSEDFIEYSSAKGYNTYYYKKDGAKLTITSSHDWEAVLNTSDVNKMFNLNISCDWRKN